MDLCCAKLYYKMYGPISASRRLRVAHREKNTSSTEVIKAFREGFISKIFDHALNVEVPCHMIFPPAWRSEYIGHSSVS